MCRLCVAYQRINGFKSVYAAGALCGVTTPNLVVIAGVKDPVEFITNQTNITNEHIRIVDRVILYPVYNCTGQAHTVGDIAVLTLLEPFTFNKLVGDPVDIPNSQLEKRAKRVGDCRRIGFGVKSHFPTEFQRLQELFVRVRSLSFCRKMWSTVGVSWDWNGKLLCTYNGYGKNSCFGHYGSPLMCFVNSRPIHVGVHLFATNPCVLGLNGVVRTLRYRTWIRAQLNAG